MFQRLPFVPSPGTLNIGRGGTVSDVISDVQTDDVQDGKGKGDLSVALKAERERVKAERERAEALQAQIDAFKASQAEQERKRAEEQGEFKRLYEDAMGKLSALDEEVSTYREKEATRVQQQAARQRARLEALPEAVRALVPEQLTGDALDSHLDKLETVAKAGAVEVQIGGRANGGAVAGDQLTKAEKEYADMRGLTGVSPHIIKKHYAKFHKGAA